MREHELKTWPEPFAAILDGRKAFEIRRNDRRFAVGDTLRLREWAPDLDGAPPFGRYAGREVSARVTYIVPGGSWGLPADLCVMGIATPPPVAPAPAPTVSAPATVRGRVVAIVDGAVKVGFVDGGGNSLLIVDGWPGAQVGDEVEIVVRPVGKVTT